MAKNGSITLKLTGPNSHPTALISVTSAGSGSAGGLWYYYGTADVKNIREILSSNDISVATKAESKIGITNSGNGHEICVLMLQGDVELDTTNTQTA